MKSIYLYQFSAGMAAELHQTLKTLRIDTEMTVLPGDFYEFKISADTSIFCMPQGTDTHCADAGCTINGVECMAQPFIGRNGRIENYDWESLMERVGEFWDLHEPESVLTFVYKTEPIFLYFMGEDEVLTVS